MPKFGRTSRKRLADVHPRLRAVLDEAIKSYDFTVITGHRGKEDQEKAYFEGFSKVRWPNSKHNSRPSMAVDIAPWPDVFDSTDRDWYEMATYVLRAANDLGVRIQWGGHWGSFKDMPHFELEDDQ